MRERKIPQCTTKRKRTAGDLIRDFVCVRMRVCVAHEQLKRIREKSINIKSRYIVISENLIWNLSQLSQFSRAKQTERVSCCCCCRLTLIFYWSIQSIGMCARFCSRLFMLSLSHLLPSQFRILYRWFSLAFGSRHTKSPIPLYRIDMANTWQAQVFFLLRYGNCYDFILNRCDLSFGSRNAFWFIEWMTTTATTKPHHWNRQPIARLCSQYTTHTKKQILLVRRSALEENSKNKHWFRLWIFFHFFMFHSQSLTLILCGVVFVPFALFS